MSDINGTSSLSYPAQPAGLVDGSQEVSESSKFEIAVRLGRPRLTRSGEVK